MTSAARSRPSICGYRYLGADFRERERIGRKARRWRAKPDRLTPLERQAVLSACLAGALAVPGDGRSPIAGNGDAEILHRRNRRCCSTAGTGDDGRHRRNERGWPSRGDSKRAGSPAPGAARLR